MLDVVVHCGLKDELLSVIENGKCRYEMEFETPAACNPTLLEDLEDELDDFHDKFDFGINCTDLKKKEKVPTDVGPLV
eukprot:TRINITY_DN5562_c0_g1_i1.p1 TRINITY_DN5562_c0_g1~~TRINITY_DN5562_c0_g1_i1.p1  ORF type:complete len:78 (+),score=16.02 TRINITY_DN5562_c0_g1_i1:103-336(+)